MANTRLSLVSRATSGVGSYIARTTTESGPTSGGLCLVAVIPGAEIAGMADWEYMNLVAVGAVDFSTVRGRLEFENDGVGNCRIQFSAPDDAEGQAGPYLAKSAYSGIATVIVVGNVSPDGANGHFLAAYDWNGGTPTLITGSDASGGYGFTPGAHGGYIGLNILPFASSLDLQKFGEFKVHSGYIATVADRCKAPEASDAGILHGYTAEEGSGDVLSDVIGSADMDLDGTDPTNRVWESGGIWAAAAAAKVAILMQQYHGG